MLLNFEWFLNVQDGKQCAKSLCASTTFQHGKEAPYLNESKFREEGGCTGCLTFIS